VPEAFNRPEVLKILREYTTTIKEENKIDVVLSERSARQDLNSKQKQKRRPPKYSGTPFLLISP